MTTVTGLTADRMLQIEAASVVDGDVDASGNLILTKKDGSQINAGSVVGPQGPQGPIGQDKSVLAGVSILDVGLPGQIRAGRQLSPADFGNLGLNPPIGLWNLSDLTDVSGNGRNLLNKGGVGFGVGINGIANTAAQFTNGDTTKALYISDTGANDPFRIKTGSIGCWHRTSKRDIAAGQIIMSKWGNTPQCSWRLGTSGGSGVYTVILYGSTTGSDAPSAVCVSDVMDDRWHFFVGVFDGTYVRLYVDGILESTGLCGILAGSTSPLNIGSMMGDGSTAASSPTYGRIDEAFITSDVLTDDQVRNLYCAKIAHTLGTAPVRASLNVHRRRKGSTWAITDFPTQPLRLHNFSAGSLGDQGSNNQTLVNNGAAVPTSGVDGTAGNALSFNGAQNVASTDAGLPSGTNPRSYGCWFKTTSTTGAGLMGWGTEASVADYLNMNTPGNLFATNGGDAITGPYVLDGQWHFVVVTEENAPADGIKRKLYLDGRVVGGSTTLNALVLGGVNAFRMGARPQATQPFTGQIDGAFVCDYVLTAAQILSLYAKGTQDLGVSPKNAGDHIERVDATNLLATFDTLDSQHTVDLAVA